MFSPGGGTPLGVLNFERKPVAEDLVVGDFKWWRLRIRMG